MMKNIQSMRSVNIISKCPKSCSSIEFFSVKYKGCMWIHRYFKFRVTFGKTHTSTPECIGQFRLGEVFDCFRIGVYYGAFGELYHTKVWYRLILCCLCGGCEVRGRRKMRAKYGIFIVGHGPHVF